MAKTRDSYLLRSTVDPALASQLNFYLARISDRLDKLEGVRGAFESDSGGDFQGRLIAHSLEVHDADDETQIHGME